MSWADTKYAMNDHLGSTGFKALNKKIIIPFSREYYEWEFVMPGTWEIYSTKVSYQNSAQTPGKSDISSMVYGENYDPVSGFFFVGGQHSGGGSSYPPYNIAMAFNPRTGEAFKMADNLNNRMGTIPLVAGTRIYNLLCLPGTNSNYNASGTAQYMEIPRKYIREYTEFPSKWWPNDKWTDSTALSGPITGSNGTTTGGATYWNNFIYVSLSLDANLRRLNNAATGTPAWAANTTIAADTTNFGTTRPIIAVNNKIYAPSAATAIRIYDIAGNSWTSGAVPPATLASCKMAHYNGKIYCVNSTGSNVYVYTISSNTWATLTGPGVAPTGATVIDGYLFTGSHVYNIDRQPTITPVNQGDQILLSEDGKVVSASNATLQNIVKNTVLTVSSDGFIMPNRSTVALPRYTVSGWRRSA